MLLHFRTESWRRIGRWVCLKRSPEDGRLVGYAARQVERFPIGLWSRHAVSLFNLEHRVGEREPSRFDVLQKGVGRGP